MKNVLTKLTLPALSLTLAMGTVVAIPVFADGSTSGSGDSTTTTTTSGESHTTTSSSEPTSTSSEPTTTHSNEPSTTGGTEEVTSHDVEVNETELHQKGDSLVATMRQENSNKNTDSNRKSFCEAHKQGLETKFTSVNGELAAFQSRVTDILNKAVTFEQTDKQPPSDWSSVLATATSAETASNNAIEALKAVTPSLDCNNVSVASDVATFKTGAETARTDLNTFKTDVRAVVEDLLNATGGSNQ